MSDCSRVKDIAVVSDGAVADLVSAAARDDLAARIAASPRADPARGRRSPRSLRHGPSARTWKLVAPVAAVLSTGLAAVAVIGLPWGPGGISTADAMSIARHGQYIDIVIHDSKSVLSDVRRYQAELNAYRIHVRLSAIPASPSLVGTLIAFSERPPRVAHGTSSFIGMPVAGRCVEGSCPVKLRVPLSFQGQAGLVFGRTARPRERYQAAAAATSAGEPLAALRLRGRTVSEVLPLLAARHVTVAEYHVVGPNADVGQLSMKKVGIPRVSTQVWWYPLTAPATASSEWSSPDVAVSVGGASGRSTAAGHRHGQSPPVPGALPPGPGAPLVVGPVAGTRTAPGNLIVYAASLLSAGKALLWVGAAPGNAPRG